MSDKKIIIDGVDVSKCPHINAYFPDSPKCQQGMGVGGCGSECRGRCSYVDKLKIHNELQQLKEENERLKKANKKIYNDLHKEICEYDEELSIEKASHKFDLKTLDEYRSALEEITKITNETIIVYTHIAKLDEKLKALDLRSRMQKIQTIITEAIRGEE